MFRASVQLRDYLSLGVMLLMFVALISGQSGAAVHEADNIATIGPASSVGDQFRYDLDGHIGDNAFELSIAVVTELSHFRGEDE